MSAHTKKRHTKHKEITKYPKTKSKVLYIAERGSTYAIPQSVLDQYRIHHNRPRSSKHSVSSEIIFADLERQSTQAGVLLKGVRARENLTQTEFAKKLGVTQANLSKMENGKRAIGKQMAKRIEKIFGVNYRYFLE